MESLLKIKDTKSFPVRKYYITAEVFANLYIIENMMLSML